MMDSRLKTFLCLCETMNYGQAAKALSLTQPAVTQHIQYLERNYGAKLMHYHGRQLEITEAGRILEQKAKAMRRIEADINALIRRCEPSCLTIGATKTIGEFVLPEPLLRYLGTVELGLNLIVDNTDGLLEMVMDSQIDFAMIEGNFDRRGFDHRVIRKEAFMGMCSLNHPFCGRSITLKQAMEETLILRETGSGTRMILEQTLRGQGYDCKDFKRVVTVNHFGVIRSLVKRGAGITFAYRPVATGEELGCFTVKGMVMSHEFAYVYLPDTGTEEKIAAFESASCWN